MDWLTFFVEMTKALAWPAAVVLVIFWLRRPFIDLIPFLEELKYKDFGLKFRQDINKVKEKVASQNLPREKQPKILAEENTLLRLAEVSPRAAILESWMSLQDTLLDISVEKGQIDNKVRFREHSRVGHAMLDIGVFDKSDFDVYHKLRKLRNDAAHVPDFALNTQDAKEYVDLAMELSSVARDRGRA